MTILRTTKGSLAVGILLSITMALSGCTRNEEDPPTGPVEGLSDIASCEGCHTNHEALKRLAAPDTSAGGGGCGGEIPHIEVYDRVHLGGEGYLLFKGSTHGAERCVTCHGGVDSTEDKALAHSGPFVASPSADPASSCVPCHASIVEKHASSLHANGWGQKSMVTLRSGIGSFEDLPDGMKQGYGANCARCHATCGDCHVNRPHAGGGGLYKGHQFTRSPNMRDNCAACHSSRIGHGYFGIGSGTVPDVHLEAGLQCIDCHSSEELHGDGQVYDQRYSMPLLPDCADCHTNLASSNMYHTVHIGALNCQTCHSQDYNNCGSCHIGGSGARIPAYLGFKIGMNPLPETRGYKFATLRRSLMAPDSWQNYGVAQLSAFSVRPTFKYTTPHNIRRWTSRTTVPQGANCYESCHIINEEGVYRNKELYLFNTDLQDWEVEANTGIVVDGRLPESWGELH